MEKEFGLRDLRERGESVDDLKVGLKLGLISLFVQCVSITRTCCDTEMAMLSQR